MPEFSSDDPERFLKEDTEHLISQFFMGVPHALKRHRSVLPPSPRLTSSDESKYAEASIECINRVRAAIDMYRDELMRQAGAEILTYLTQYSVRSKSCDPLKLAYWFGLALASKVGQHHELDKKVVLILTIWILDMFCEWDSGKSLPEDMRAKLDMSISHGKNTSDFGEYGVYFAFKVVSKLET